MYVIGDYEHVKVISSKTHLDIGFVPIEGSRWQTSEIINADSKLALMVAIKTELNSKSGNVVLFKVTGANSSYAWFRSFENYFYANAFNVLYDIKNFFSASSSFASSEFKEYVKVMRYMEQEFESKKDLLVVYRTLQDIFLWQVVRLTSIFNGQIARCIKMSNPPKKLIMTKTFARPVIKSYVQ